MNRFWQLQARRIDERSMRERVFMFLSFALVLVAAADALVLSPQFAEQKELAERMHGQARELASLRQGVAAAASGADTAASPQVRLQAALAATRDEQRRVDAALQPLLGGQQPARALADLVERVLRHHERLTLLRLQVSAPRAISPGTTLALHGVEISISGRYPDLVAYLAELERALPALRWGELHLAEGTPPTLTVQLHTLGAAP